jgi:hypothetical protein
MYLGQVRLRRDSGDARMEVSSNCGKRAEGVEAIGYVVFVCLNLPFCMYVLVLLHCLCCMFALLGSVWSGGSQLT